MIEIVLQRQAICFLTNHVTVVFDVMLVSLNM